MDLNTLKLEKMNYKKYHKLTTEFNIALEKYVVERNEVDDSYHIAKVLLSEMNEKAFRNKEYLEIAFKWFNSGSTLELKEALIFTSYKENNLAHSNAMCLLDAVSACLN